MSTTGAKKRSKQTEQESDNSNSNTPALSSDKTSTPTDKKAETPTESNKKSKIVGSSKALLPNPEGRRHKETEQPAPEATPQSEKGRKLPKHKAVNAPSDHSSQVSSPSESSQVSSPSESSVPTHEKPSGVLYVSESKTKKTNRSKLKADDRSRNINSTEPVKNRQKDTEIPSGENTTNAASDKPMTKTKKASDNPPLDTVPITDADIDEAAKSLSQLEINENKAAAVLEKQGRQVRGIQDKVDHTQDNLAQAQVDIHNTENCCYSSCFKPQHPQQIPANDVIELQKTYTPDRDRKNLTRHEKTSKMKDEAKKLVEQQKAVGNELDTENQILQATKVKTQVATDQVDDIVATGDRIVAGAKKRR